MDQALLLSAVLMGLAGTPHCLAMCGAACTAASGGGTWRRLLPFHLGRTVHLVGITGELQMGIDLEPARWTATLEEFAQRWQAESNAYAVLNANSYAWARQHDLPMRYLARNARLVVVSRR